MEKINKILKNECTEGPLKQTVGVTSATLVKVCGLAENIMIMSILDSEHCL